MQLWFCSFSAFPEWVEHITSTEKDLGSDYTMSCVASGKPEPQIRWMKNGELVTPNSLTPSDLKVNVFELKKKKKEISLK